MNVHEGRDGSDQPREFYDGSVIADRQQEFPWIQRDHVLVFKAN